MSSSRSPCSSRAATRACSAASWPLTAAVSTRGNCSRTPSCTCTATCPSASASSRPLPSPPWIPWPGPGSVPPRPGPSCASLDDLELVPVRILELEHGRNPRPPEQVPDLDPPGPHGAVLGLGIGHQEPDAGVGPGVRPGDQRDRGGRARSRDRDPPEALAHPDVEPLLEAERADEELHRLVLVADRDSYRADVGDGGLGHDDLLASLDELDE